MMKVTASATAFLAGLALLSSTAHGDEKPAGAPAKAAEVDPYDAKAIAAEMAARPPAVIYTKASTPASPRLEELPLRESVSQYGITWTFEKPARAGRFVNGDWYVVGPATVRAIDPPPLHGRDVPEGELDHMDRERPV